MMTVDNNQDGMATDDSPAEDAVVDVTATGDTLCDSCAKLFGEPSANYRCACHRGGQHYHLGRVDDFLKDPPAWSCPGCRLVGTIVTNMRAMIRRNDHGISPALGTTGVTAELKLLEEMVARGAEASLGMTTRPAARVINVKIDVLPGMAGTIVKMAGISDNDRVHGLRIPRTINMDRSKRWLTTCREGHAGCRRLAAMAAPVDGDATSSIRLIDVHTRQIVPSTLDAEFVALSYVWGTNTQPLLTGATLPQYSAPGGLDGAKLPKTIAGAIAFVGDLGLRFLWVDSLCIVQDDDADKQKQLPQMAALYEAAELVIVAAAGRDAAAGLSGYQTERPSTQAIETLLGACYTTAQGGLHDVLRWTHWDRRGWTYQEAFQARRAIVLTDTLMYWSCRDTLWREDLDNDGHGHGHHDGVVRLRKDGSALWRYTSDGQRTFGCTPNTYFTSVEHFSSRTLRDGGDALWAYWGVLAHQAVRFPPNGYLWGHPYGSLTDSLLWRTGHFCLSEHGRRTSATHSIALEGGRALRVPFPSWSWLSTDTAVEFLDTCGASIVTAITWHPPITLWNPASTALYLQYLQLIGADGVDEAKQLFVKQGGHLNPAPTAGQAFAMDYGLLCFTAETAQLTLSRKYEHTNDDKCPCRLRPDNGKETTHTYATVREGGKEIGGVTVPLSRFNGDADEVMTDVVLLASNASPRSATDDRCKVQAASGCGEVQHIRGCQHVQTHNLMVVAWEDGVAYLQALLAVDKAAWEGIPPEKKIMKRIALG